MSDVSRRCGKRPLTNEEKALLHAMLEKFPAISNYIDSLTVSDMRDGGMGSVKFDTPGERVFGKVLVQADFRDDDGVPVSVALNVDQFGELLEIDFWKMDFSPLCSYPTPSQIDIKTSVEN